MKTEKMTKETRYAVEFRQGKYHEDGQTEYYFDSMEEAKAYAEKASENYSREELDYARKNFHQYAVVEYSEWSEEFEEYIEASTIEVYEVG